MNNVLSFQQFMECEHSDTHKAETLGITDITDQCYVIFFTNDCYITYTPTGTYSVQLGNIEDIIFISKTDAARFLYLQYYLPECTTLLDYDEKLKVLGFRGVSTGGNCTALEKTLKNKSYILITDDDANIPRVSDSEVCIGLYDQEGEYINFLTVKSTEIDNAVVLFTAVADNC